MKRILITGAAGYIGGILRRELRGRYPVLRLSDIADMGTPGAGEEIVACDLADAGGVEAMMAGVDAVVHLGAISTEDSFDRILAANIVGTYNVFEGARRQGVPRVVFASSNHAIGFYERAQPVGLDAAFRPDSRYGVSKAFGEIVARYYFDKFGLESASLRIGTAAEAPQEERHLSTWISPSDLVQLVGRCLDARPLGCAVVYGVSNNSRGWWSNEQAGHLGFLPADTADDYAEDILAAAEPALDPDDPARLYQGGCLAALEYARR